MAEEQLKSIPAQILSEVSKVVVGKEEAKRLLLVALLGGGHVLIEGFAGTGKTLLAKTFARVIGGQFKRIQFTPDMLPADITGFYFRSLDGTSHFVPGPVFTNILLADELNRATPRTQSALIEAMQENQVTIEGITHPISPPFITIASQLPYGFEGTYPLTEVQSDRFMLRIWSDYPSIDEEGKIISEIDAIETGDVQQVSSLEEIEKLKEIVRTVFVHENIKEYIVSLVRRLREDSDVALGPSPRASIALYKGARALALLEGRDFVIPDDVKGLAVPVLAHRIRLRTEAEMDGVTVQTVIERALEAVPVPR